MLHHYRQKVYEARRMEHSYNLEMYQKATNDARAAARTDTQRAFVDGCEAYLNKNGTLTDAMVNGLGNIKWGVNDL